MPDPANQSWQTGPFMIRTGALMPYQAYLFDFDYTLGDATQGIVASVHYALQELKLPLPSVEDIRRTVGLTLAETFERLTGLCSEAQSARFVMLFKTKADEVMTESTSLYADTIELLTSIKAAGYQVGIVTTKYHHRITSILHKYQISHLVDVIVGGDDVKNAKPHPEALLAAIRILKIPKRQALYIGDSEVDAETACRARVDFVAVTSGVTGKDRFIKYPHVAVIANLSELKCQ
jgi:phosphoglycolate phosphatase